MTDLQNHQRAIRPLRHQFEAWIRTGHWGTCVDCPVLDGRKIPELCRHAQRFDHQLTLDALVGQYRQYLNDRPIPRDFPDPA